MTSEANVPTGTLIEGCVNKLYITPKGWTPNKQLPITVDPGCGDNEFVVTPGTYAGHADLMRYGPELPPDQAKARHELWYCSRPWYQRLWLRLKGQRP